MRDLAGFLSLRNNDLKLSFLFERPPAADCDPLQIFIGGTDIIRPFRSAVLPGAFQ